MAAPIFIIILFPLGLLTFRNRDGDQNPEQHIEQMRKNEFWGHNGRELMLYG